MWDNITTVFSWKSPLLEINVELSDADAYLFSEPAIDFKITASHPMRINDTMKITVDRVEYGEACVEYHQILLRQKSMWR